MIVLMRARYFGVGPVGEKRDGTVRHPVAMPDLMLGRAGTTTKWKIKAIMRVVRAPIPTIRTARAGEDRKKRETGGRKKAETLLMG
jgi:hypothetical protein